MTHEDLWRRIKNVTSQVGIEMDNFYVMRSRQRLPSKWVVPIYEALKDTDESIPLEQLSKLATNQHEKVTAL
jgi:hypothetical protein